MIANPIQPDHSPPEGEVFIQRVFLIRLQSGKKYNFLTRAPIDQAVAAIRQALALRN